MRNFTITFCLLFIAGFVSAQNATKYYKQNSTSFLENTDHLFSSNIINQKTNSKKPIYSNPERGTIISQQISTAGNAFSTLQSENNCLALIDSMNTVLFIHRNDNTLYGYTIGQYRYDISKDRGQTFDVNIGVLNPSANNIIGGVNSRFPQAVIHNPIGNSNIDSAWLVYIGAWHNGGSDNVWEGLTHGVMKLDADSLTRTEHNDTTNNGDVWIASSLCNGLPGEFWAVDNETGVSTNDSLLIIYKGVWDSATHDFDWQIYNKLNPNWYNINDSTFSLIPVIAFDPTGMKGWIGSNADYGDGSFRPYFYKTIDGGVSWQGPIIVDLTQFVNIMSLLNPNNPSTPTMAFDLDIAVDKNGDPHMVGAIGSGDSHTIISNDINLFDITYSNDSAKWLAIRLDTLYAFRGDVGIRTGGKYRQDNRPHITSTTDGSKLYYTWSDNQENWDNATPDLLGVGYNVNSKKWSKIYNFSNGDPVWSLSCTFPSVAPTCFRDANSSTVPVVITLLNQDNFNAETPVTFHYLKNITFYDVDFIFNEPYNAVASIKKNNNSVNVFPNPATNSIMVSSKDLTNATVSIYNILGQQVKFVNLKNNTNSILNIDIKNLINGMYTIEINNGKLISSKSFVVKH